MAVTYYQHIRPIVSASGFSCYFCIILLQFKLSFKRHIIYVYFIAHPHLTICNHDRIQYTLFSLYRSEIAEILGVSQLAPGLVLLSPVYGENAGHLFFFKILQICIGYSCHLLKALVTITNILPRLYDCF